MGLIRAVVQDEKGNEVAEAVDFRSSFLPVDPASQFRLLSYIDPYGDTIFNRLQVPDFLRELRLLSSSITSDEDRAAISKLEELAQRSQAEPHLYLKFMGD